MNFKVAQVDYDYPDSEIERQIIEKAGGKLYSAHLTDSNAIIDFAKDADAIICQYAMITKPMLEKLPKCRVISRYGIGLDNVDVDSAKELGIYVAHNPAYCIEEVSNHAIAMILTQYRQIAMGTYQIKHGIWNFMKLIPIPSAENYTIGIIGLGHIGTRVAQKLRVFGFSVIAYDPYKQDEAFKQLSIKRVSLETLMAESDCITIHCSLTDETKDLINLELLSKMKRTAYLVNTSRGPVVDLEALTTILEGGLIRGAALDVLPTEPPKSFSRIAQLPSLLLTPHIAFYSDTSIKVLRATIAEQVVEVMQGKKPQYNAY
jgi:D-3-phosphoglycerate dehydrogenase